MTKRKKQTPARHHAVVASAVSEPGGAIDGCQKEADAKRLALLLMAAAAVFSLVLNANIYLKARIDAVVEEMATTTNGDASTAPEVPAAKKSAPQRQMIDLSKFEGSWALVTHFSKTYDAEGLHAQLKQMFDFNERAYSPSRRRMPLQSALKERGAGFDRTTRHKLEHDLEQFDYFLRSDLVGKKAHGLELFRTTLPAIYKATLTRLDRAAEQGAFDEDDGYYKFREEDAGIMAYYNRALFLPELPPVPGPVLAPRDWSKLERQWFGEDADHPHPGIVVVDDLLSPQTLERLRNYLLLSTIWYEAKTPRYGRYLGAYLLDGMHDKMLTEIAFELHKAMPRVMKYHHLKELWSYKYESSPNSNEARTGIHVHADDAMVNVNLWITPDDANLEPRSGGLVVYTVKPPREWSFNAFNANWEYIDEHLLRPSGYANVTIPYLQNRAVIFDSFLFHKTDNSNFKPGYENRRINLTFLYGDKQSNEEASCDVETEDGQKEL